MNEEHKPQSADGLEVVGYRRPGTTFLFNDTTHPQNFEALCLVADAQRLAAQLREELAQRDAEIERLRGSLLETALWIEQLPVPTVGAAAQLVRIDKTIAALESQQAASVVPNNLLAFFKCCKSIIDQLEDSPKSAFSRLRDAVADIEKAASVGGEREAYRAWYQDIYKHTPIGYDGTSDFRAFQAGAAWRSDLSPAGGGVVMNDIAMDALDFGDSLNEAGCVFLDNCPEKSALLFNNCKRPLRLAIIKYLELEFARLNAKPQANSQEAEEK